MNQPERVAQKAIVKWLRLVLPAGSIVAAIVNEQGGKGTALQRARFGQARKASGVVSGFPDIVALLPEGRTFLLELKRPPERSVTTGRMLVGRTSEAQDDLHPRIQALGHHVYVATCIDTARTALHKAGIATIEASGQPMPEPVYRRASRKRLPADAVPF